MVKSIKQIFNNSKNRAASAAKLKKLRELYLETIAKCLIGLIYKDRSQDPWNGQKYDPRAREYGLDWPATAHSMIGLKRMENLRSLATRVIEENIPGDFIETGVWRGGACIMMNAVLETFEASDRLVWVADSFEGLPKPSSDKYPADRGDLHHTHAELAISIEEVKANFAAYGLLNERVRFLKGWFKDTLPNAPIEKLAILRLDGDMYESTMDALVSLYDRLSIGGYVIVDDYGAVPSCQKAVSDFRAQRAIDEPICDIDWTGIFWRKTRN